MKKSKIWIFFTVIAVITAVILGYNLFNQKKAYATTKENDYNILSSYQSLREHIVSHQLVTEAF